MNFYCDMDGVLVDLLEGYRQAAGVCLTTVNNIGDEKWLPALAVPKFWQNLPKLGDADVLVDFLTDNIAPAKLHVLSARMELFNDCDVEKIKWLAKNTPKMPVYNANIVDRHEKQDYAVSQDGEPNILIDDFYKNIDEWIAAGGIGILHTDSLSTIETLQSILQGR